MKPFQPVAKLMGMVSEAFKEIDELDKALEEDIKKQKDEINEEI